MENSSDSKKEIWKQTAKELNEALSAWDQISNECPKPAPDEQMLQDMQLLLKKLQSKLKELS